MAYYGYLMNNDVLNRKYNTHETFIRHICRDTSRKGQQVDVGLDDT